MVWERRPSALTDAGTAGALLSPAEIARMRTFIQTPDQLRFLTAWSLARQVLGELSGQDPRALVFDRTCTHCGHPTHGKPRLVGGPWQFSLSHTADRVLLAVAEDCPVGVDIESADAKVTDVSRLILHPDEPPVTGVKLLRIWVRKEAVLKATGHGLARPMTGFSVLTPPKGMLLRDLPRDDGYVAAVAAIGDPDTTVELRP